MPMDWDTLARIGGLIAIINGGLLWAVKWLVDQQRRAFEQRFEEFMRRDVQHDENIQAVRDDLQALEARLPREYVHRDDWIMSFGRFEQKLDGIWQFLHNLRDRIDGKSE